MFQAATVNGPEPIGFSKNLSGAASKAFCGRIAEENSARLLSSGVKTFFSFRTTVRSSGVSNVSMPEKKRFQLEASLPARFSEKTTSAAVTGVPSENFASRSLKV